MQGRIFDLLDAPFLTRVSNLGTLLAMGAAGILIALAVVATMIDLLSIQLWISLVLLAGWFVLTLLIFVSWRRERAREREAVLTTSPSRVPPVAQPLRASEPDYMTNLMALGASLRALDLGPVVRTQRQEGERLLDALRIGGPESSRRYGRIVGEEDVAKWEAHVRNLLRKERWAVDLFADEPLEVLQPITAEPNQILVSRMERRLEQLQKVIASL